MVTKAERTWSTDARGTLDLSTAQAPATWGAAMDVPENCLNFPSRTEELIFCPGASKFNTGELFEKLETLSVL